MLQHVDFEQLLTAAGFIVFLLYQNSQLLKRIKDLESERAELTNNYIDSISKNSSDIMEATRMFDKLTQAMR